MTVETKADFARRLGVNRSTVTRLDKAGRLVLAADGRVDVEPSLARLEATRGTRYDVSDRHAAARGAEVASTPSAADRETPAADDTIDADLIGLRTRRAQMREREAIAAIKEREAMEQSGQLVRRAEVVKAATDAVAVLLNTAEALPDRATPLLLGCNDAARIRAVLRDEVEQLFQTASEQLVRIAGQGAEEAREEAIT
jgi:hypothetical protein